MKRSFSNIDKTDSGSQSNSHLDGNKLVADEICNALFHGPEKREVKKSKRIINPKTDSKRKLETGTQPNVGTKWTKDEVRQLWAALDIVPAKVSWEAVSAKVDGRSKTACRDKWLKDILPKMIEFVESRGE